MNKTENKIQTEQIDKINDLINISLKETNLAFTIYKCKKMQKIIIVIEKLLFCKK